MPRITPIPENEAADNVTQTHECVREMFEGAAVPQLFLASGRGPDFLRDYMNFK